jgi:hypothetical protein
MTAPIPPMDSLEVIMRIAFFVAGALAGWWVTKTRIENKKRIEQSNLRVASFDKKHIRVVK